MIVADLWHPRSTRETDNLQSSRWRGTSASTRDACAPRMMDCATLADHRFLATLQAHFMATSSSAPLTNSLAHQLANFACTLEYEHLGKNTVHEVKRRLIDSFGCALGAWNEEPCTIARGVATDFSAKLGATMIGTVAQGAAGLGGFRERVLHPLFRLQRHLSLEGAGASERQYRGGARGRRERWARRARR